MLVSDFSQSILNLNKKSIGTKIITWELILVVINRARMAEGLQRESITL
jgi:hypothetical protein